MAKLTAIGVKALVEPGRHTDGQGLHLYVKSATKRSWVLRYTLAGRRRDMGLGDFPDVSLAEARRLAAAARTMVRDGRDPLDARASGLAEADADQARTFRAIAHSLLTDKAKGWRNAKHRAQWRATLKAYAFPVMADLPVSAIGTDEVLRVLRPVWDRAPETASRLRGRIEAVLDAAAASGWREGPNPARWKGHLSTRLPAPNKVQAVTHHPALAWSRIGAFMATLAAMPGLAGRALAFAILTAARTGEVRGMRWGELDLAGRTWTVPAARMKAGVVHRVPLSRAAMSILDAVKPPGVPPADALVFPGMRRDKPLSDAALSAVIRRMNADAGAAPGEGAAGGQVHDKVADQGTAWADGDGRPVVPHGFRSTFRDWAGETRPDAREVVERCLAHVVRDKVEAAYARGDLLERRRPLMEAWGVFCARPEGARVVDAASVRARRVGA